MEERVLLRWALILAFLGLAALYALLLTTSLPLEDVSVIDASREGSSVRVAGTVTSTRLVGNGTVTLLTVTAPVSRTAVVFAPVNVTVGERVVLEGRVQEYRGSPELVVEQLEVVG